MINFWDVDPPKKKPRRLCLGKVNTRRKELTSEKLAHDPLQLIGFPIVAPFWADVDTRGDDSELVKYSHGIEQVNGRPAFGVNWVKVGYFNSNDDKLNSFQIVLIERSDTGNGNFDVEFNYDLVAWETADVSGGVDG